MKKIVFVLGAAGLIHCLAVAGLTGRTASAKADLVMTEKSAVEAQTITSEPPTLYVVTEQAGLNSEQEGLESEQASTSFDGVSYYQSEKEARYQAYAKLHPEETPETIVMRVNIGIDQPFFTEVETVSDAENLLVLVNKFHCLEAEYVPSDLVLLTEEYSSGEQYLREEAAEAFAQMCDEAALLGYEIQAVSAYRSYEMQETLYNRYVERSGRESADTYSARAGYSEHQTGLAVDIKGAGYPFNEFGKTKECEYIYENAHTYGFILRYPVGARFMTGYIPEAWHLRYVGKEVAAEIYEAGITFEEYCVIHTQAGRS